MPTSGTPPRREPGGPGSTAGPGEPTASGTANAGAPEAARSVAEETRALLEVLHGLGVPAPDATSGADGAGPGPGAAERSGHTGSRDRPGGDAASSRPLTCGYCPVCRGMEFVTTLPPDTVDRVADLAAGAAGLLRDLARVARSRSAAGAAGRAATEPTATGRAASGSPETHRDSAPGSPEPGSDGAAGG